LKPSLVKRKKHQNGKRPQQFQSDAEKNYSRGSLNAQLDEHFGYDKHQVTGNINIRNGYSAKTLMTEDG